MSLEYNDLYQLIPLSAVQNVACFVIYDEHPRDDKRIDITICSKQGEVQEYYKKTLVSSVMIPSSSDFRRIIIVRSNKCDLYYLVEARDEIIILSRKDTLCEKRRFRWVKTYELCDLKCTGEVALKINTRHSTKYYSIDNEFENINEINGITNSDDISSALGNKLKEAVDNLESNKKAYNHILNLRQRAAYFVQTRTSVRLSTNLSRPNLWLLKSTKIKQTVANPGYGDGDIEAQKVKKYMHCLLWAYTANCNPDDIIIKRPIVQFCNKNIVILLQIKKKFNESMENVCVLIHNNSSNSISFTTKYFDTDQNGMHYTFQFVNKMEYLETRSKALIAAVIPVKEFKNSVISKIEFNLVVSYQRQGKDYLHPCENVYVSASEVMGKNFDVFNGSFDKSYKIWAILFSTKKTTLCLKQIIPSDQFTPNNRIEPTKIFCDEHLKFESVEFNGNKIAVHRFSPHHILHGTMIVFNDNNEDLVKRYNHYEFNFKMDVYTRSSSQVLALIHFIHDSLPHTVIVTTPNIEVNPKESATQDEEMDISYHTNI